MPFIGDILEGHKMFRRFHIKAEGCAWFLGYFLLLCPALFAIGYEDFPENLQWVLDERLTELEEKGQGFCIAGRVQFEDGRTIYDRNDVKVNLVLPYAMILNTCYDGWFIGDCFTPFRNYNDDRRVYWIGLRAYGYEPIDEKVDLAEGQITYFEYVMKKTPEDQLSAAAGRVIDENGHPIPGAKVYCHFRALKQMGETWVYDRWEYMRHEFTDPNGVFCFDMLRADDYFLIEAWADGYANYHRVFDIKPDTVTKKTLQLFPNRQVVLRYVYQPDGSPSFTDGALQSGTVTLKHNENPGHGLTFSAGQITQRCEDLRLEQFDDKLFFDACLGSRTHEVGNYDTGLTNFEHVTEADTGDANYTPIMTPCRVGHVYVVRTYDKGHYAKFQVLADEYSFRTVWPDTAGRFEFRGYGLAADVIRCSGAGKMYVRKIYTEPENAEGVYLPMYWELFCTDGAEVTAAIHLTYDPKEIEAQGLEENKLIIYSYDETHESWNPLRTFRDSENNHLHVVNHTLSGYLMIGME